jgi:hypothetical protein
MTSRSCTYLRSVSTNSLMMLFRAASCAFGELSDVSESGDSMLDREEGDNGTGSKTSSGSLSTMLVTVAMTYRE